MSAAEAQPFCSECSKRLKLLLYADQHFSVFELKLKQSQTLKSEGCGHHDHDLLPEKHLAI